MNKYWFEPKQDGAGFVALNWKGGAFTAAYILVVLILTAALIISTLSPARSIWGLVRYFALVGPLTLAFLWVCKKKTNGPWRWR
jgi:hypothetical protein